MVAGDARREGEQGIADDLGVTEDAGRAHAEFLAGVRIRLDRGPQIAALERLRHQRLHTRLGVGIL